MPGVCSFKSNSNRLLLGTYKRGPKILSIFLRSTWGVIPITNFCGERVRKLLTLSHSQKSHGRGFSINKRLVCENQKEKLNCKKNNEK